VFLMMKRLAFAAAVFALVAPSFAQAQMQMGGGERGEAKATVSGKPVAIEYGRPSLKGRDMLAQAAVGQPWRMGSGNATTLKTDANLSFGPLAVPKGDYVLTATRVAADQWQLDIAKADKSKVVEVPLTSETLKTSVETFTIDLKGAGNKGDLTLSWGTTALKTSFTGK
jgi:hypothetical protein